MLKMKNVFWKYFPYALLAAYVLITSVILVQINNRIDYILKYPVRISQEARDMITRLREMQNTMQGLLATPNLSYHDIEYVLKLQEAWQDHSLSVIKELFHDHQELVQKLEKEFFKIRKLRREASEELAGNADLNVSRETYESKIAPQVDVLYNALNNVLNYANQQIHTQKQNAEKKMRLGIAATLATGVFIAFAFIMAAKRENAKTQQLVTRDKLFNQLSHNVDEVFVIASGTAQFDFVSSNSKRLIGITENDIVADPAKFYAFLPGEDAGWLKEKLNMQQLDKTESRNIGINDSRRFFKLALSPIHGKKMDRGCLVVLRDQTQEMQYQQALSDALETARMASQAKSSFLSHMSHEIRTPMNAIIGMTTIALSKQDNPQRVEDCLRKIAESSRHLLGLINDILDMSKIENGKLSISREAFSLPHCIQNINDLIRPQAVAKKLNFEISQINVDQDELIGDELRLNQILLNILSNALKFTPAGGTISLAITQLSKKNNSVSLRFVIRDTGIGMSQDFLKHMYKPFEQATQMTTAKYGGTGLGMSITLNLITLMDGTIHVDSKEGEGTTFTVELPFSYTSASPQAKKGLPPLKILVVDDDHDTCEQASLILEKMGLAVRWCTSGKEAVKLVLEARDAGECYNVCFIDWQMPEMNGAATARQIRAEVGPDMLIIIISAYDWNPIEAEARTAGVNDFVAKPFFASTLYNALVSATHSIGCNENENDNALSNDYDFTGKRILLVEDNEFNREIANEFLDMVHATVENAEDGNEALDMFMSSEPGFYDLILMDVQMPIMDGYEATRAIRGSSHNDAKSIPIIAMTANAFNEDVTDAQAAGMNGHIAKPIDVNALYKIMKEQMEKGK